MANELGASERGNVGRCSRTASFKERLERLKEELRAEIPRLSDRQGRALFEVSAEVVGGLVKAFTDYERRNETAWTSDGDNRGSADAAAHSSGTRKNVERIPAPEIHTITLRINGEEKTLSVASWTTLLDLLRETLNLSGTKKGCDHGQCGACTVLVDGKRINSCLTLAVMKDGSEVITIEGLAENGKLHPMQQAFIDNDAFQCGYCTPGQICSAIGLLQEGKARTTEEIRELMSGNLCRCGAYPNIVAAIQRVIEIKGEGESQ